MVVNRSIGENTRRELLKETLGRARKEEKEANHFSRGFPRV
jgi:hypothetical protein